jgi:hypothetical protein
MKNSVLWRPGLNCVPPTQERERDT